MAHELRIDMYFVYLCLFIKVFLVESKSDHHDEEVFERIDVNQIRMRDERSKSIEIRKVAHARLQSERAVN